MLLLSWNVNGIRSVLKKGLLSLVESGKYDVLMFQEAKADILPLEMHIDGYSPFIFSSKTRRGYSGTITLTKETPKSVIYGIDKEKFDDEGRVLTIELEKFYVVNAYFPNSRRDLSRLGFKLEFNKNLEKFLQRLREKKPVIIGGDFNVAHEEIDIARPKENVNNAGFTDQERASFTEFLKSGYCDSYRLFVKDGGHYTWWSYRANVRSKNIGWRIDYFVVSNDLEKRVKDAGISKDVLGSDHAPIYLETS